MKDLFATDAFDFIDHSIKMFLVHAIKLKMFFSFSFVASV